MVLFDTNILVHAHLSGSAFHTTARQLRDEAAAGRIAACLSPQVLCEFFAVCTDARIAQPALTPRQAAQEITNYWEHSQFRHVLPKATTMQRLARLLATVPIVRRRVFDAFLAATMLDNDVRTIYTQNTTDFAVYKDLEVINPFAGRAE